MSIAEPIPEQKSSVQIQKVFDDRISSLHTLTDRNPTPFLFFLNNLKPQLPLPTSPRGCSYQVFLSFRGKDTRANFTDHLYTALEGAGIRTFIDEDGIESGESIMAGLRKAIQQSRASIIVFSKHFASSRWCLDELVLILKRRRTVGHMVLPIFYDVNPSQVRNQSGTFQDAFSRHETCFDKAKVEGWRGALREVADLKGMELQKNQRESKFIQGIVKEIEKKLQCTITDPLPHPLGMDDSDKVGIGRFQALVGPLIGRTEMDVIVTKILLGLENVKLAVQMKVRKV